MSKRYTEEERREALSMAKEVGVHGTSQRMGINKDTLYTWQSKAKHRSKEVEAVLEEKGPEGLLRENEALKKALKEKEEEVEILQDALGFFVERRKK